MTSARRSGRHDRTATASPAAAARLGAAADQRVSHAWPWRSYLPGWRVAWLPARDGLLGGTWTLEHRIEVYVRSTQRPAGLGFTLAHELGHAADVSLLTEADRAEWRERRRHPTGLRWWVPSGASDFGCCAGDLAESFAAAVTGDVSRYSAHFKRPTVADRRWLLARVGERADARDRAATDLATAPPGADKGRNG